MLFVVLLIAFFILLSFSSSGLHYIFHQLRYFHMRVGLHNTDYSKISADAHHQEGRVGQRARGFLDLLPVCMLSCYVYTHLLCMRGNNRGPRSAMCMK